MGEFLTPALARAFAQAFGTYVGSGRVVVGRDTRASGPMLQHAVQCGLLAAGCEVVDVGVLPTPTIQIYTGATRARGGQDKGQRMELTHFVEACRAGAPTPIPFESLVATTSATIAVTRSLSSGHPEQV